MLVRYHDKKTRVGAMKSKSTSVIPVIRLETRPIKDEAIIDLSIQTTNAILTHDTDTNAQNKAVTLATDGIPNDFSVKVINLLSSVASESPSGQDSIKATAVENRENTILDSA